MGPNSSRRDFTAEAQRGKRTPRKTERRLNTKSPRHKGQKEEEMRDVLRKKDNKQFPVFSFSYPYSYSNSSRRDFHRRGAEGEEVAEEERERDSTQRHGGTKVGEAASRQ